MELYPFSIQPIKGNNCGLIPHGIKGVVGTDIGVHRTGLWVHLTGHIKGGTPHSDDTKHPTVVVNTQPSGDLSNIQTIFSPYAKARLHHSFDRTQPLIIG